jgi:hypothetical protein
MKPVYKIKDFKEREKLYRFYGAFNYENNIMWRSLFISACIAACFIYLVFKYYPGNTELNTLIVLYIVFITYYFTQIYKHFHMYRVMASNVKPGIKILEHHNSKQNLKRNTSPPVLSKLPIIPPILSTP